MSQQIILTDADVVAIGGSPATPEPIAAADNQAVQPMALAAGGWALPLSALPATTQKQRDYLAALPVRDVQLAEYQWFVNAQQQGHI